MSLQNDTDETSKPSKSSVARRIAGATVLGLLVFVLLWLLAFSLMTSMLFASGTVVVLVAASTWSDALEMVLDWFAGILAAIYAGFMSLLDL